MKKLTERRLYFAYGSNMSRARLEARVGWVRDFGRAQLHGYRHRFSKLGQDGTGKGNIEAEGGAWVWGVLYELSAEQFETLRGFEGGYRSIQLTARSPVDATPRRALSFVAERIVAELSPTPAYLEHYRVGMREHGVPADYVAELLGEPLSPLRACSRRCDGRAPSGGRSSE